MRRILALFCLSSLLASPSVAQQVVIPPPAVTPLVAHSFVTGYPITGRALPQAQPGIGDLGNISGGTVVGNPSTTSGVPTATSLPVLGVPGSVLGALGFAGNTSGIVTIKPQAAAGTYNFNLPITAGSAGQPLLSAAGGTAPMTFGTLSVGGGGTGQTTLTSNALLTGNGASGINQVPITGLVLGNGASAPSAYGGTSGATHQFNTAISAAGVGTYTQPAFTDITGSITSAQCPNATTGATGCVQVGTGLAVASGTVSTQAKSVLVPATPANPNGNATGTAKMQGIGTTCTITTSASGTKVHFDLHGNVNNAIAGDGAVFALYYGTGTAPANAAAVTGTVMGQAMSSVSPAAGQGIPFDLNGDISGLSVSTAYWFDLSLANLTGGTAATFNLSCTAHEIGN